MTRDKDGAVAGNGQVVDADAMAAQIKAFARQGAFREAEHLRRKLQETAPMALTQIIQTADVIDEEKTKRLDRDHLAIWADLYENLSDEEVNTMFYCLKPAVVPANKLLMTQGKAGGRLFLIDAGRVNIFFRKDGKNHQVIQLGRGDFLGEDTFFDISHSSLSALCQTDVKIMHVTRKDIDHWYEEHPGLYEKLADYMRKNGKCSGAAQKIKLERRQFARYPAKGVVTAYILNKEGKRTTAYFRGEIIDISQTGVCFSMKCPRQETARALLSRQIDVSVDFMSELTHAAQGRIVKLGYFLHNDYSVHVKFSDEIDRSRFKQFPCEWGKGRR